VVLPAPKKPVITVTGIASIFKLQFAIGSVRSTRA